MAILIIDNYDSFTYNLVQQVQGLGFDVIVRMNDEIDAEEAAQLSPSHLILSPGPGRPSETGHTKQIFQKLYQTTPTLGVCLGHQLISEFFGGQTIQAPSPIHGKSSPIVHDGTGLFTGIESPMTVARYHSLVSCPEALPASLHVTATCGDLIMAVAHHTMPIFGVQFHPESILTPLGNRLIENFFHQTH